MADRNSINLIQLRSTMPPWFPAFQSTITYVSYASVILLLLAAVTIGSLFVYTGTQLPILENRRAVAVGTIQANQDKESKVLAMRMRMSAISKILSNQISLAPYIDTTLLIARPPMLTGFSIGKGNTVSITVTMGTLEEAKTVITTVLDMVHQGKIRSPILSSFSIDPTGKITFSLSYVVLL